MLIRAVLPNYQLSLSHHFNSHLLPDDDGQTPSSQFYFEFTQWVPIFAKSAHVREQKKALLPLLQAQHPPKMMGLPLVESIFPLLDGF